MRALAPIGIIGGADGPTKIILSGNLWAEAAVAAAVIAGLLVLFLILRKK